MTKERSSEPDTGRLTAEIRRRDRRLTSQREAVLETLRRHPHPLTSKEIHAAMEDGSCDLATIYRSMKLLVEMGLVERFDFGDGIARFELSGQRPGEHHHHLICTKCQAVHQIEECFSEDLQRRVADRFGFTEVTHKLEFFGVCPHCRDGRERPRQPRECGCR